MSLSTGARLGAFEITGQLGAGGMGEVYRATDTRLGREVAIKTLPAALAEEAERLARFEREAKLLASLNHAHIAAVHSLDEHEGALYVAMELVEGETLEDKLKAGPLPVETALDLGLQIAAALEAAHDKGVVHRDLKPANVMVTPDGVVKVLDFGLAKAFSGDPNEASPTHSPALSLAMTQQGLVLGTAGYMSPEQASGQATDQRADIWAFGVVLYEMLTGQALFSGETVPHILAAVLQTEPDWARLPKRLHPLIRRTLERCLRKKPRDRYHSIADVRVDLEEARHDPQGVAASAAVEAVHPSRSLRARLVTAAAAAAVGAAITGLVAWQSRPAPPPAPVVRFTVPLPEGQSFSANPVSQVAISPDGARIAYVADGRIYLRSLADATVRPVAGTESSNLTAATPVFSPDGQWLAYLDVVGPGGPFELKRVPISGGAPVAVYEAESAAEFPHGLDWPAPDTLLFANHEGVVRMPANGGSTEVLVPRGDDERFFSPQLLPGGETVLFARAPGLPGTRADHDAARIVVQSIGADDRTVVWEGGSAATYLPSGHLVYAQGTALFALAFDARSLSTRGGPVPMVQGVRRSSNGLTDTANVAISETGTLAMLPGNPQAGDEARVQTTLTWVDRDGRETPLPVRPDDYTAARISPDGTKVALVVGSALARNTQPAIWIYDLRTENLSLLASDPAVHDGPVWSSDSRRIFFRALGGDGERNAVYAIELETRETTLIASGTEDFAFPMPWALSPDQETLAVINAISLEDVDIARLSLGNGEFEHVLRGEADQNEPSFSPDGAWLAYFDAPALEATGEINIRPFPDVSRTRIPVGPGGSPVFSRDGSELFFFDGSGIAAAPIAYEPSLRVGAPRRLFASDQYLWNLFGRTWDPDPSGERFVVIRDPQTAAETGDDSDRPRIDVVLNWIEELETRVPTR